MKIRKQRLQGIYAWPEAQLRTLDEMLSRNLTYKEIVAAFAAQGIKTSGGAVGAYYGRSIKNAVTAAEFAAGAKTVVSRSRLKITISAPDGFVIKSTVANEEEIQINVSKE